MAHHNDEYVVYVHTFPNGKKYIGITSQIPEYRWDNGRGYKGSPFVYGAIRKYGWENIQHEILFDHLMKEDAEQKEIELILLYNTTDKKYGYNLMSGGYSSGKHSKETREKISNSRKGKCVGDKNPMYGMIGEKSPSFGKITSEETRQKLRNANSGKNSYLYGKTGYESLRGKIVRQYDKQNNLIAEYGSILEASRNTGINNCAIGRCCSKKSRTSGGFVWRYVEYA